LRENSNFIFGHIQGFSGAILSSINGIRASKRLDHSQSRLELGHGGHRRTYGAMKSSWDLIDMGLLAYGHK